MDKEGKGSEERKLEELLVPGKVEITGNRDGSAENIGEPIERITRAGAIKKLKSFVGESEGSGDEDSFAPKLLARGLRGNGSKDEGADQGKGEEVGYFILERGMKRRRVVASVGCG